jgi:sigma-E factor negative regulatory protein RseC
MIEEKAQVIKTGKGVIWVETERQSTCTGCSVKHGCGTSVLANLFGNKTAYIRVLTNQDVSEGDTVLIGINESSLVKSSFFVYAVPIICMLLMAILGELFAGYFQWGFRDISSILAGALGLVLGFIWLKRYTISISNNRKYQPVLLKVIGRSGTINHLSANFKVS